LPRRGVTFEPEQTERAGFPSPHDVPIPRACDGWEEMYAGHMAFGADRRAFDDSRFWVLDVVHGFQPIYPLDALSVEYACAGVSQASSRLFVIPPSNGFEIRILNGFVYWSPNAVSDGAELARRAELFQRRGGHYYQHWDELYAAWVERIKAEIDVLEALEIPELPEFEEEEVVLEGRGLGSGYALLNAWDQLVGGLDRVWQYHFEFSNLGYGGYLFFYELCRQAFPDIADQTIAKMVSGIDVLVLRPDDELRRLAFLAVELGVAEGVKNAATEPELSAALAVSEAGALWLEELDAAKDPWFNISSAYAIWYHDHRSWRDDPGLAILTIGSYVERLEAGESITRPYEAMLAERDRITAEYGALLPEDLRRAFDERLDVARRVFPFVEDHAFYIDHWYGTLVWNKVRPFGALLARYGFLEDEEDVFFLRHDEVRAALEELRLFWSGGCAGVAHGPGHWPPLVVRRKAIHRAMRNWTPPPVLGRDPGAITDPFLIMLAGITTERIQEWLVGEEAADELTGATGSPGKAEGPARVITDPSELAQLEDGEILVARSSYASWTPVFGTIVAAVLDTGGIMCHAAIVAREYGLPAVVGTGNATQRIRTGDRIRVDADNGRVTIL
jgi:pyruvate,water dikinase